MRCTLQVDHYCLGSKMGILSCLGKLEASASLVYKPWCGGLLIPTAKDGMSPSLPSLDKALQGHGKVMGPPRKIPRTAARVLTRQTTTVQHRLFQSGCVMWPLKHWKQVSPATASSRRKVLTQGSWVWANGLETSLPTPSTRDSSISTVTHGIASLWWSHCGDTAVSYALRSKLILSTSFNCWLDCTLQQAGML